MPVVVIVPPADVIALDDAKRFLRVDFDDDDELISSLIEAVVQKLDAPTGWLGRALGLQTLELQSAHFPGGCWREHGLFEPHFDGSERFGFDVLALPFGPVQSIISVTYVDPTGVLQTLDPSLYALNDGLLASAFGTAWPEARLQPGSVRIRYTAGYPKGVPAPIRAALLLMLGTLYENRSDLPEVTGAAAALLAPFRVIT